MSIIDTILGLFGKKGAESTETEQEQTISEPAESVPEPVAEPEVIAESKPEPEIIAEPAPVEPVVSAVTEATAAKLQVPEDSTLRRHFLSKLKAEIESGMPAAPTDATLKRHYDAQVQSALDDLLN